MTWQNDAKTIERANIPVGSVITSHWVMLGQSLASDLLWKRNSSRFFSLWATESSERRLCLDCLLWETEESLE